jgi:hypothetical protein
MLDVRLVATCVAMSVALMSVALAEPTKDQAPSSIQSSTEARPIRVILPAPWESGNPQPETRLAK